MKYTHIVFDVDGTLINSEYAGLKSFQETLLEVTGRHYTPEELLFSLGIPGVDALKILGVEDAEGAWAIWEGNIRKYLSTLTLYDGIPQVARTLKESGARLGVVTSRTTREFGEEAVPVLGELAGAFGTVVLADHTALHKPSPDPLLYYLNRTGARAEEVLYLGDTLDDSRCARDAGVDFALAGWGSHGEIPAKYILNRPEELLKRVL